MKQLSEGMGGPLPALEWSSASGGKSFFGPASTESTRISDGEMIVSETLAKSRSRPVDQERLDSLASPQKRGACCSAWKCPPPDPLLEMDALAVPPPRSARKRLEADQLKSIVARLAVPKEPRTLP